MRRLILLCAAAGSLTATGCRHNPVSPGTGVLYVSSYPSNAEVMLDGVTTNRRTPLRLDGVGAGDHRVTVRYFGYKATSATVAIPGGASKRLAVALPPVSPRWASTTGVGYNASDMEYNPLTGRMYIANQSHEVRVYQVSGAQFTQLPGIAVQSGNQQHPGVKLLAVNHPAGKLYAMLASDSLVAVDIVLQQVVRRFRLPDSSRCVRLASAIDGCWLFIADSLNNRIWRINAQADTVAGSITLPGPPSDVLVDRSGEFLYVTILNPRLVVKINAHTGTVLNQSGTGASPGGLFCDDGQQRIGFCNRTAKQVITVQLDPWTLVNGPGISDAASYSITGLFAADRTHQWVLTGSEPYWQGDVLVCDPGYLHLIYCPGQLHVTHYPVLGNPVAMTQSADGRYIYVLNRFTGAIVTYLSDTD